VAVAAPVDVGAGVFGDDGRDVLVAVGAGVGVPVGCGAPAAVGSGAAVGVAVDVAEAMSDGVAIGGRPAAVTGTAVAAGVTSAVGRGVLVGNAIPKAAAVGAAGVGVAAEVVVRRGVAVAGMAVAAGMSADVGASVLVAMTVGRVDAVIVAVAVAVGVAVAVVGRALVGVPVEGTASRGVAGGRAVADGGPDRTAAAVGEGLRASDEDVTVAAGDVASCMPGVIRGAKRSAASPRPPGALPVGQARTASPGRCRMGSRSPLPNRLPPTARTGS